MNGGGGDSQRTSSGYGGSGGGSSRGLASPLPSPSARQAFPKALSDKYRLGEELGRGAFGQVYRGLDTRTGQHVAIKQLSMERIPGEGLQGIMNEVELLKNLNHRNIVKYMGSFKSKSHLYIILEFMENGALSTVIKQNKFGPFPESLVAVYTQQVLQGLAYLHDQGVVHRDIKGANILTTKEGLVKLADFGVAAKLVELEAESQQGREAAPVGTPYWMAPEVVELKSVTTASDIWSVGCLAIELLTGSPPYYDLQPLSALYNIVQDKHPPLPADISMGMHDFLMKCFQKDPAARPTARELLQHSWISYNRRTLKSSWSRTRGMKGRGGGSSGGGPLAEGYTNVSTVVERILQSTADSEASGFGGSGGSSGGGPDSLGLFEQQQQQASAAAAAATAAPPLPLAMGIAAAAPVFGTAAAGAAGGGLGSPTGAKQSMFSVVGAAGQAAAAGGGAKLPAPPSFGAAQQQRQQQAGLPVEAAAPAAESGMIWSKAGAAAAAAAGPCGAASTGDWQQQQQQLTAAADPTGLLLLQHLQRNASSKELGSTSSGRGAVCSSSSSKQPVLPSVAEDAAAAVEASAQSRHDVAEVKRQVAGMRILTAARERSFVQEAAATASCRALLVLLARDAQLRAAFLAADGASALRELLDNPSDRVLDAALDLLLALSSSDAAALQTCCQLGFIPAVLCLASPPTAIDLRLQAAAFAEVSCSSSASSAMQVVACQGVPFLRDMIDEQQQHPQQQMELAAAAVGCFWLLLRRVQQPGWPLSLNQFLRLLAHHNLPLRLVRFLPRLMQARQQAAAAAAAPGAAATGSAATAAAAAPGWAAAPVAAAAVAHTPRPSHIHSASTPQTEAELALLSNDELASSAGSLTLRGEEEVYSGGGAGGGGSSSSPTRQRWLGRALPGSPTRLSRMRGARPAAAPPAGGATLRAAAGSAAARSAAAGGANGVAAAAGEGPAAAAAAAGGGGVPPHVELARRLTQLLDSVINLVAVMGHGDPVVKARLCQREVLAGMMGLAHHMNPPQQLRVLRWVRQLSSEQLVLQALEEADAVPYVVAQLRGQVPALQADALGALHNLCQLSRPRQEQAAAQKAVPPLVLLVQQQQPLLLPSLAAAAGAAAGEGGGEQQAAAAAAAAAAASSRGLAVSLLCCFAHGGPRSRQEMWAAGAFDTLLLLLKEEAHQVVVLDALAAWLDQEPPRAEARLLDPEALARLVTLLPAGIATSGGDGEQLQSLLASMLRLLQRSPRLAVELAQNGLAPRVVELLKRPNATAALSLLQMLRAMYEHHPRPKEFIVKFRVQQALAALAHGQSATNQVLVRKQAQNLLDAFQINVVF